MLCAVKPIKTSSNRFLSETLCLNKSSRNWAKPVLNGFLANPRALIKTVVTGLNQFCFLSESLFFNKNSCNWAKPVLTGVLANPRALIKTVVTELNQFRTIDKALCLRTQINFIDFAYGSSKPPSLDD